MQVDLAGSERIKESGSEGMRLTEAQVPFYLQQMLSIVSCRI